MRHIDPNSSGRVLAHDHPLATENPEFGSLSTLRGLRERTMTLAASLAS